MYKNPPILSPRLLTVANLIEKCRCVADIGTDHAYLPTYLCMNNICDRAIASDIVKGPLERARKTVLEYNMENKISLRLGAGLEKINKDEADAIVIAGMGGLIIAKILDDAYEKINSGCRVVLQPMTAIPELRKYLSENGWDITKEVLAKEENKIYNIISVSKTEVKYSLSQAELYLGRLLVKNKPMYFDEYLEKRVRKLENIIKGLKGSETEEAKIKLNMSQRLLEEIKQG